MTFCAGLLPATICCLSGSGLGVAGFLQAWLGHGLQDQVLACIGAVLKELEPDQRCTILLTGKHFVSRCHRLPFWCELGLTKHLR